MKNIKKRVAVIDIGTLKTKFEIQEFNRENIPRTIYRDKKLTVIGRDMQANQGNIGDRGLNDTLTALSQYVDILESNNVDSYKVVATETIRKARNTDLVLQKIQDVVKVTPEILTHEEEAAIYYEYVAKDFKNDSIAVVDVGGGSVQIVIGRGDKLEKLYLLKTGSYFLQESDDPNYIPSELDMSRAAEKISTATKGMRDASHKVKALIYGSSNIQDVFSGLNIPMQLSGYTGLHKRKAKIADMAKVYKQISGLSYKERMPMLLEEPYYMWSIDKAFLNIFELADILGVKEVVPSNANLSSGIMYQLAAEL